MKKRVVLGLLAALCCLVCLAGCASLTPKTAADDGEVKTYHVSPVKDVFAAGETVTVMQNEKALYTLTINSVKWADEEKAVVVNYTYQNLGMSEGLYISEWGFKALDSEGAVCDIRVLEESVRAQIMAVGETGTADAVYSLEVFQNGFRLLHYGDVLQTEAVAVFQLTLGQEETGLSL